jgi:hypothetical protein
MPVHENLQVIADMAKHNSLEFCLLDAGGVFPPRVTLRMNGIRLAGVKDWR